MMNRTKSVAILGLTVGLLATPAWADFKIERSLTLEPGGMFILESDIGDVVLTGDSTSGARIVVTSEEDLDRYFDLTFDDAGRTATVRIKRRGVMRRFFNWFDNDRTRITVRVPRKTDLRVNTSGGSIRVSTVEGIVGVHTSGGSIDVDSIAGNVDGSTSGGGVRMRNVRGDAVASTSGGSIVITDVRGRLRANTSGGGINIDAVSGDLRASTSGGSVDVRGAGGRVDASSSGGGVTVRFAPGNSSGGVISSSGGSVRTEIDPGARVSIDATASGGSVTSDVPITIQGKIENDSLRGDMNGGGALLRLRSSGGGVRIASATSR